MTPQSTHPRPVAACPLTSGAVRRMLDLIMDRSPECKPPAAEATDNPAICLCAAVARVHAGLRERLGRELQAVDLSVVELRVILAIHDQGLCVPSDIAREHDIDNSLLTRIVDALEAKSWLRRCPNEKDRRSTLLELTDSGRGRVPHLKELLLRLDGFVLRDMTEGERQQLHSLLRRVRLD